MHTCTDKFYSADLLTVLFEYTEESQVCARTKEINLNRRPHSHNSSRHWKPVLKPRKLGSPTVSSTRPATHMGLHLRPYRQEHRAPQGCVQGVAREARVSPPGKFSFTLSLCPPPIAIVSSHTAAYAWTTTIHWVSTGLHEPVSSVCCPA